MLRCVVLLVPLLVYLAGSSCLALGSVGLDAVKQGSSEHVPCTEPAYQDDKIQMSSDSPDDGMIKNKDQEDSSYNYESFWP